MNEGKVRNEGRGAKDCATGVACHMEVSHPGMGVEEALHRQLAGGEGVPDVEDHPEAPYVL